MKIYLEGAEGNNWSIDHDNSNVAMIVRELGFEISRSIIHADIIYSVWWNKLLNKKYVIIKYFKKDRPIIATITNDLAHQQSELRQLAKIATHVVYANYKQKNHLLESGYKEENIFYCPFYVDEKIFKPLQKEKNEIANILGIEIGRIENRILIGNFQRDSLGIDLNKPKWQKNPDLLIEILYTLKDVLPITLILAGPRRHYIYRECMNRKIPVIFIGDVSFLLNNKDDMQVNILSQEKVNLLYNFIDAYLLTSQSEGGPKAVIEAALSKTSIISTDVGLAPDYLHDYCIFSGIESAVTKILELNQNADLYNTIISDNYAKSLEINNLATYKERIKLILQECIK